MNCADSDPFAPVRERQHPDLLLVGANAGYIHSALALRCVQANLGALAQRVLLLETDAQDTTPVQLLERLLALRPRVIGFSVYLWNAGFVIAMLRLLRTMAPDIAIVVGGPHLVPEELDEDIRTLADAVVCGEAEAVAGRLFGDLLQRRRTLGVIRAPAADLERTVLPYDLYTDADLATRMLYVESSRGCPFRCDYCTSAGSGGIRFFPLDRLLPAFRKLIDRGARKFKFLDRSFNQGGEHSLAVLDFFLGNAADEFTLHLEFTPDPPTDEWKKRLLRFPPGALHIEVGIQTWDPDVARRIRRPLQRDRIDTTLRFLIEEAGASVHADLIAGLPGETLEGLSQGFDHLVSLGPAELQVGILKRLPGTSIVRHASAHGLVFSPDPPYEILATERLPFETMRRVVRFARCWDLLHNRGRFPTAIRLLWANGRSPFSSVLAVADEVQARHGRLHALSPKRLAEAMLALSPAGEKEALCAALERDARTFRRAGPDAASGPALNHRGS